MSDLKINITILCDQVDCTFNKMVKMNRDYTLETCNKCIHPHPAIQRWGEFSFRDSSDQSKCACNSKDKRVTDPPIVTNDIPKVCRDCRDYFNHPENCNECLNVMPDTECGIYKEDNDE
jgi:hypothetical protein